MQYLPAYAPAASDAVSSATSAVNAAVTSVRPYLTPVKFVCIVPSLGVMFNGSPIGIDEGTTLEALLAGPVSGLIIDGDVYMLTLNTTTMPWSLSISCQGCSAKNIQAGLIMQVLRNTRTYQVVLGAQNQFTGTYTSYKGGPVLGESFAIGTDGSFNVLYVTSPYTPNLAGEIGNLAASTQTLSATLTSLPLYFCKTSGKKQVGSYVVVQTGSDIVITAQASSKLGIGNGNGVGGGGTAAVGTAGLSELCGIRGSNMLDDDESLEDGAGAAVYGALQMASDCNDTVVGLSVTVAVLAVIVVVLGVLFAMSQRRSGNAAGRA